MVKGGEEERRKEGQERGERKRRRVKNKERRWNREVWKKSRKKGQEKGAGTPGRWNGGQGQIKELRKMGLQGGVGKCEGKGREDRR